MGTNDDTTAPRLGRGRPHRVMLLLPSASYRTDFVDAAAQVGAEVVVVSDARQAWSGDAAAQGRTLRVDFDDVDAAVTGIVALANDQPVDAVIAADERGVRVAAEASRRLGLPGLDPAAAAIATDKALLRAALDGNVDQPRFACFDANETETRDLDAAALGLTYPVVVKPRRKSASQGVVRADDAAGFAAAVAQANAVACDDELIAEEYVPGIEVAVEGLVRAGRLEVLAIFDKPDPLTGPYFAETLYVTPTRLAADVVDLIRARTTDAVAAIGVTDGPVHAELRVHLSDGWRGEVLGGPWVIEVAARTIGGLCARTLRFGLGVSLEQLVVRHALGLAMPPLRSRAGASGVAMIPVETAGTFRVVDGIAEARAVPGIVGLEITIAPGTPVEPLPQGDRYVGFVFAQGPSAEAVESALRTAWALLSVHIKPDL